MCTDSPNSEHADTIGISMFGAYFRVMTERQRYGKFSQRRRVDERSETERQSVQGRGQRQMWRMQFAVHDNNDQCSIHRDEKPSWKDRPAD